LTVNFEEVGFEDMVGTNPSFKELIEYRLIKLNSLFFMKWRNTREHILLWVLLTACCYGSSTKSTTTPMSPSKNAIADHLTQSILFSTGKATPTIHVLDLAVQGNLLTENSVMAATTVATASQTTITAFGIEHNSPNSPSIVS
jgi:hypothetical protein